ncbi:uncharacterized protein LOC130821591 [Amaranthus tricolor]|uniref:uncharacterized protein LOC130821591 n=1 Tax=Amaranthus tricolor TaxID=29722 RepID=UPI00258FE3B6|nr:uncharacterized protein LOC130821591 [Amaranthus tricolor]
MVIIEPFPVKVGLYQGSALCPFILTVIMEETSKSIWETVPWCMIFADDIVLVAKTREEVSNKLDEWREALEGKGLRISRTKTEYLRCDFSGTSPWFYLSYASMLSFTCNHAPLPSSIRGTPLVTLAFMGMSFRRLSLPRP